MADTTSKELELQVQTYSENYTKFTEGNKAAGTRARKALAEISKLAKTIRKEIQEAKNASKDA
jgi:hypothetical protein